MLKIKRKINAAIKIIKHRTIVKSSLKRGDFSSVIWLIGDGRSGTTWIANLLNADKSYREMFEPFHPVKVTGAKTFQENMYIAPEDKNEDLYKYMQSIFNGSLTNLWVDKELPSKEFSGLLVKDVFANLHAKWAIRNFEKVKPILLIRNPLSVASSKYITRRWNWPAEPELYLADDKLMSTHLIGLDEVIKNVKKRNDFIEKQVLNWCIIHKVLTNQFSLTDIHVICYEEAYLNPKETIKSALEYAEKEKNNYLSEELLGASSIVSFKGSSIVEKKNPLTIWQENITEKQFLLSKDLLTEFGLSNWYPNFETPDSDVIRNSFLS